LSVTSFITLLSLFDHFYCPLCTKTALWAQPRGGRVVY